MIYIDCPACSKSNLLHGIDNIHSGQTFICGQCFQPFVIKIYLHPPEKMEVIPQGQIFEEAKK